MNKLPVRALHVFGLLNRTGGAEKWILDMLHVNDPRVRFDFLVSVDDGPLVREVQELGSKVHLVPFSRSPIPWSFGNPYLNGVRNVLRRDRYDVVHVHQFDLAGEILKIASEEEVPGRIMSVHATEYENPRFYRRFAHRQWGRPWIFRYARMILPCSDAVGLSFCGDGFRTDSRVETLYTGIDTALFHEAIGRRQDGLRESLCREFNIPLDARVVGHIGRFTRQKNQFFLLELLDTLMRNENDLYGILVGRGELLDPIRRRVQELGREDRIIVPGPRGDVPDLLTSLFDVMLLPSLYEGLPIVGIEALAAGLGLVLSDRVCDELAPYFPDRVVRIPLEAPIPTWCEAVRTMISHRCDPLLALNELEKTPLTIKASLEHLIEIYTSSRMDLSFGFSS